MNNLLLFGASDAIASGIRVRFEQEGWQVTGVGRSKKPGADIAWNILKEQIPAALTEAAPFDAVVYAQGANLNDSAYNFDRNEHMALYEANCLSVAQSLHALLTHQMLKPGSRLCVISSIWQDIARQNKLSYCMTKAALRGLVLSASADLAKDGHLINAVLPGALETPMTRANLTPEQITTLENSTQFKRLPGIPDVAHAVWSLCSPQNTSITGQFIAVDLSFSHVRLL